MENVYLVENVDVLQKCPICKRDLYSHYSECGRVKYCTDCLIVFTDPYEMNLLSKIQSGKTKKALEKKQFIQDIQDEVYGLKGCVWDSKSDQLVGNITSIFNKLIEYIENN